MAVPSIVEIHTEKSLRCIVVFMSGTEITTQYSTVGFMSSLMLRILGGSIPTITAVDIIEKECNIYCDAKRDVQALSGTGTSLIGSPSLSIIVISATTGLMITCCSTSPGRVVRLRKKVSTFSGIISLLVISTKKHRCRCVFENGPTSWFMIAVKSLSPGDLE